MDNYKTTENEIDWSDILTSLEIGLSEKADVVMNAFPWLSVSDGSKDKVDDFVDVTVHLCVSITIFRKDKWRCHEQPQLRYFINRYFINNGNCPGASSGYEF